MITLRDNVPQDYTKHIPLVLQHWERPFTPVWQQFYKEVKAAGYVARDGYRLCFHTGWYIFEQYQIVAEFGSVGEPLRIFFPDEHTETLILLKAKFK